jgi:predicted Zn-dependent protease
LAHEVGHVFHNHSMRNVVQTAGMSMVLSWILGDLSMVTDVILVGVPSLLQQLSYSRNLESEADQFALHMLESQGYSAQCFSSLMSKLSESHDISDSQFPDYLSSHPNMKSRIDLGASAENCSYDMSEIDWQEFKILHEKLEKSESE